VELKRLNGSCHYAVTLLCYGLREYRAHFLQISGNETEKFGCCVNEEREKERNKEKERRKIVTEANMKTEEPGKIF
jgi:hypothetical protein